MRNEQMRGELYKKKPPHHHHIVMVQSIKYPTTISSAAHEDMEETAIERREKF